MSERFLVTGAAGCLGAWTVAQLVQENTYVVAFDLSDDRRRLRLVVDRSTADNVEWAQGDLTDFDRLTSVVEAHRITHVIHLAALQVPFCKADPVRGSQVNVTGTVKMFEAVRRADGQVRGLAFASSVAVYGPASHYRDGVVSDEDRHDPATLYGVYKHANEATARIYFDDWGVSSVGLRPCIVYGPGRDQGLTSSPTVAMLNAAAGVDARIDFGGSSTFHHAHDVAAALIACARLAPTGAAVHNVGGADATVAEIATVIEAHAPGVNVTYGGDPLALPAAIDGSSLAALLGDTDGFWPLDRGIAETMHRFRELLHRDVISPS